MDRCFMCNGPTESPTGYCPQCWKQLEDLYYKEDQIDEAIMLGVALLVTIILAAAIFG